MKMFKGSGVALVTPFTRDDTVDYTRLGELIEWHILKKTDAIVVCGTTGESSTLSREEKQEIIDFAVEKVARRIPVIAGTGGNNTREAIALSQYAANAGVDALLVVTPYYNKGTQRGLLEHFTAVADTVSVPVILYNVPSRTGISLAPETVARLAEHARILGIKEASGDIGLAAHIAKLCPDGFALYSGNDDQILPMLSLGGVGVISVVANVLPYDTHRMIKLFLEGRMQEALELQLRMLPLIHALFLEVNPIPVKSALTMMGMDVGHLRLPLTEIEVHNKLLLRKELMSFALVDKEN